jgi:competence protein ComGC
METQNYKVVFEMEVQAENFQEAAREVDANILNGQCNAYIVQNERGRIKLVDLNKDTIITFRNYKPLIN